MPEQTIEDLKQIAQRAMDALLASRAEAWLLNSGCNSAVGQEIQEGQARSAEQEREQSKI